MRHDLSVELVAEHNHILELVGNWILLRIAAVPDLRFAEETESRPLDHLGCTSERVGSEKDCCSEDSLESGDQSPVLLASRVHSEGFQHLRSRAEANRLALLAHRKRGQVNRNHTILPKWQPVVRMPRDL